MNKGRCHGLTIIFSLLVSGGSPIQDRFGNTPICNKALFVNKPHTYQKKKHPYFIIPFYALTKLCVFFTLQLNVHILVQLRFES